MATADDAPERGREARGPTEIPTPGWRDIALRVKQQQSADNLSLVAGGVAFFAILALFPALAAAVSIYAIFADPAILRDQMQMLSGMLPSQAQGLVQQQLGRIVAASGGALSLSAALGILIALWSATKGTKGMMSALNITYDEREERGFLKLNAIALLLTLGGIVGVLLAVSLVVALPAALGNLGLGEPVRIVLAWARWPLLAVGMIAALALMYRFGPDRSQPQWRWVSVGSVMATVLWIAASVLFSLYVANFGSYNETYGSLGAVIILLLWLQLTAYIILLGAEINAEIEHQTARDTTAGRHRRRGERGAEMADTVGGKPQ